MKFSLGWCAYDLRGVISHGGSLQASAVIRSFSKYIQFYFVSLEYEFLSEH